MKIYIPVVSLILFIISGCSRTSKSLDIAREKGIKAASGLVHTDRYDQMALQNCILSAKAIQSEYLIAGDTVKANEFEKAYMEYIKTHDTKLAEELF